LPKAPESENNPPLRLVPGLRTHAAIALDPGALAFPPPGPADRELEWYFTMAESDMGDRSNFSAVLGIPESSMEDRAEASHAQRTMRRRFVAMGMQDVGVLQVAYVARRWPLALRKKLGRVTGVVVRLAAADVGLPDDDVELGALELRTADRLNDALARDGTTALERVRPKGVVLLRQAFQAYLRERGGASAAMLRGTS
jgi:hypothetical protein